MTAHYNPSIIAENAEGSQTLFLPLQTGAATRAANVNLMKVQLNQDTIVKSAEGSQTLFLPLQTGTATRAVIANLCADYVLICG